MVESKGINKVKGKNKSDQKSAYLFFNAEEKIVLSKLDRIAINAKRKAFRKNAPIIVIRKGKIIKIYRNRKVEVIGLVKKNQKINIDITKPIYIK